MFDWTRLSRVAAPAHDAVDLVTAKNHCRVYHDDDDAYIETLIAVASAFVEGPKGIGTALCTQTWRLSMDGLPKSFMIGLCPVQSITSITVNGTPLDPASYSVDLDSRPARVAINTVPRAYIGNGAVKVTFETGYGDPADVPADLKHAILLLVGHFYENREATISGGTTMEITEVPFAVHAILSRYQAGHYS